MDCNSVDQIPHHCDTCASHNPHRPNLSVVAMQPASETVMKNDLCCTVKNCKPCTPMQCVAALHTVHWNREQMLARWTMETDGWTLLWCASDEGGGMKNACLLLEHGASFATTASDRDTALLIASMDARLNWS